MGPKMLLEKEERIKAFCKDKQKLLGGQRSNCSRGNQKPRHGLLREGVDLGGQGTRGDTGPLQRRWEARGAHAGSRGDVPSSSLALCSPSDSIVQLLVLFSLEVGDSRPGCFTSWFAGWTCGCFQMFEADALRSCSETWGFLDKKISIKHENLSDPRTEELQTQVFS